MVVVNSELELTPTLLAPSLNLVSELLLIFFLLILWTLEASWTV